MLLCNVVGELLGPPWVTDAQVRFSHDCHNYMISENSEMTREPNDLPTDTCDKWSKKVVGMARLGCSMIYRPILVISGLKGSRTRATEFQ